MPSTNSHHRSLRVPVRQLRRECDPRALKFKTTAEVPPLEGTVGQNRAVSAMNFGLGIEADGFNVFVSGLPGTGRTTELRTQVERIATERPAPRDWVYVFNFRDPSHPRALSLPPDRGHQLSHDVEDLVVAARKDIPAAFESDEYAQRRDQVNRETQTQRERFFETVENEARQRGFTVNATPMGINTVPMIDGHPATKEQYDQLSDERKRELQKESAELDSMIAQMAPQLRRIERGAADLLAELDKQVVVALASPRLDELKRDYGSEEAVVEWLESLGTDFLERVDEFRGNTEQAQQPALPGVNAATARESVFDRYKVNVLVTHAQEAHAPVVFEENPRYYQMFGRIDYRAAFGSMATDHTMIKPGALHRANGGFLIVNALDLLSQPLVWDTLKRALRTRQVRLENIGEQFTMIPTTTLTPEPIPLDVKVAVIGTPRIYALLQQADEDFQKLFKTRADFTVDVQRDAENVQVYARFIARQGQLLGMRPFDRAAVATVVEQSSRMVSDQEKLSLRMMDIVDLLIEADYLACEEERPIVLQRHVEQAIENKIYRSNLIEERVREYIDKRVVKVDVSGAVVGQVNGLSVHDFGDYAFGRPSRITARVSMGRGQVINLERETQKSGAAHSKGFLTLTGYLNGKFAHRRPLSFAASITFEQVYDEVDGDSAASTELYALISAITDVPLRQGLAVTGSIDQLGNIQAIGGVNEKVEGFYAVCKARGLTGDQGVIIPRDNVRNLMLKPEVVHAVRDSEFHIYAVSSVEEGIELLTGMPAGKLRKDGTYAPTTLFRKVTDTLEELTRRAIEVNRAASAIGAGPSQDGATERPPGPTPPRRKIRARRRR